MKTTESKNRIKDNLRFIWQTLSIYRIMCFRKKIKIYFYFTGFLFSKIVTFKRGKVLEVLKNIYYLIKPEL